MYIISILPKHNNDPIHHQSIHNENLYIKYIITSYNLYKS